MSAVRRFLIVGSLVLALGNVSNSASAQDVWGMGWGGWGGYWNQPIYGGVGSVYGSGYLPVPPYFAVHPPVYYGSRVYRSYGDSPYAYPPSRPAAAAYAPVTEAAARPSMIMNPYCDSVIVSPSVDQGAKAKPAARMIYNPYVLKTEGLAQGESR